MNLPRAITTLYVQEYRDTTLNTEFGKSRIYLGKRRNPNFEPFEPFSEPFDHFVSKSGQFEIGKKPKISTTKLYSSILTILKKN